MDYARTTQFIRGLYDAILDSHKNTNKIPVHVLYTGTGPYAPLMLAMTKMFTPAQVQFTLVEVHPLSFEYVNHIVQRLNLTDYVHKIEMLDATKLSLSDYDNFDICITETMNAALKKEPQVAITGHISRQMEADAIFIPQKVHIYAGMSNPSVEHLKMNELEYKNTTLIQKLGTIMELVPSKSSSFYTIFPKIKVEIPKELVEQFPLLSLYTEIDIYGKQRLTSGVSAITMPQPVLNLSQSPDLNSEIYFQYQMGKEPGFIYHLNS